MNHSARNLSGIQLTKAGWVGAFLIVWVPLAALLTMNNFLFIIFSMLVGVAIVSHRLAVQNLRSISVVRRFPEEIFAQSRFALEYVLQSDNRAWGSVAITLHEFSPLVNGDGGVPVPRVTPRQNLTVTGLFTIAHRGDQEIGNAMLASSFPFGLAVYRRQVKLTDTVLVFPAVEPVREPPPIWNGGVGGAIERQDPLGGMPFNFRQYVAGDPCKHIDWKKSARTGDLITRVLAAEGAEEVVIRLPAHPSEAAISRVASLVAHFGRMGAPIALHGPGIATPAGTGPAVVRKMLTILARWEDRDQDQGRPMPSVAHGRVIEVSNERPAADGAGRPPADHVSLPPSPAPGSAVPAGDVSRKGGEGFSHAERFPREESY
jgi:uncharacterized protein (DUF58 family)